MKLAVIKKPLPTQSTNILTYYFYYNNEKTRPYYKRPTLG